MKTLLCLSLFLACSLAFGQTNFSSVHGFEPHFILPEGQSQIVNLKKDYGAKGDGVTDDTQAFLSAINDGNRKIYLPEGTYLVSEQLRLLKGQSRFTLMGEKRSTTILKLKKGSAGFNDPSNPKIFLHYRNAQQQPEQNFHNYLYHLTIEIGEDNAGAIALNFHTNNSGAIKDVAIRATDPINHKGFRGLSLDDRWFGPGSARFLEIEGFQEGIWVGSAQNHTTLEYVNVSNCDIGLNIKINAVSARRVDFKNCAMAVKSNGHLTLLNSKITGGSGGTAIENTRTLFLKDISLSGYQTSVTSEGQTPPVEQNEIESYTSSPVDFLWEPNAGADQTLDLPESLSPEVQYPTDPSKYAVMPGNADISDALQQAIDEGKEFIYVPTNKVSISKTIILRNKVKKIMGLGSSAIATNTNGHPGFRLADGTPSEVTIELIYIDFNSGKATQNVLVEQASKRSLVLRHGSADYRSTPGGYGGKVYMESVVGRTVTFTQMNAYVQDINIEDPSEKPDIINDNSKVTILGYKTEKYSTKILTKNGGATELLGASFKQQQQADEVDDEILKRPLFVIENASASFNYFSYSNGGTAPNFQILVQETRNGVTRERNSGGNQSAVALFVGYESTADPGTDPEDENLITNGNFSEGETAWRFWTKADVASGSNSVSNEAMNVSISDGGTSRSHVQLYQPISIVKDQRYEVTFKGSASSNRSILLRVHKNSAPYDGLILDQTVNLTNGMQSYGPFYFTGDITTADKRFDFYLGSSNANVTIDDVVIKPVDSVQIDGDNLVRNPTFDNSKADWNFWTKDSAGASGSWVVTSNKESKVIIDNGGAALAHVQLLQKNLSLVKDQQYLVSYRARANGNRTIRARIQKNSSNWVEYHGKNQGITSSMTTYDSFTFTSNATTSDRRLVFLVGGSTGTVWIDDVSVTPIGTSDTNAVVASDFENLENSNDQIVAFPNPVRDDYITILNPSEAGYTPGFQVLDLMGRELYPEIIRKGSEYKIDFTKFQAGVYLIKIFSRAISKTIKVVKVN